MTSLLIALDFSDSTSPILKHAGFLGSALNARLLLLHVVEPISTIIPVGPSMDILTTPAPLEQTNLSLVEKRLETLASSITPPPPEVIVRVDTGLPAEVICRTATQEGISYILLGSHGHGAIYQFFAGSVVTSVLKSAPCPVLVVPTPSRALKSTQP